MRNPSREFLFLLDDYPFPSDSLDLFLADINDVEKNGRDLVYILAGTGCPYRCIFCAQHAINQGRIRERSAENIFAETKSLFGKGFRKFAMVQETFLRDPERLARFCSLIENSGLPIEWTIEARADQLDFEKLARMKKATVSLPGGCAIGARPINLHLMGLEAMGAKVELRHGYIEAKVDVLKGANISFDTVTVTGTENLMMAATLAKGKTSLQNAAMEPEVVELANVLNKMGAKINGAGTNVVEIEGVESLHAVEYRIIPDRIEAGTLMVAAGLTRGNMKILHCPVSEMEMVVHKLRESGMEIESEGDGIRAVGTKRIRSVDIKTQPYPGFPTDMQAQFMVLMSLARGLSVISETIFENRFIHVSELRRMGADIRIQGDSAIIQGVDGLSGAPVMATDLRASASLILAGLAAEGVTEVSRVYHLDRGYEGLEKKLAKLGANIKRVKEGEE